MAKAYAGYNRMWDSKKNFAGFGEIRTFAVANQQQRFMKKTTIIALLALAAITFPDTATGQSKEEDRPYNNINFGGGMGSLTEKIFATITYTYNDGSKETKKEGYDLHYDTRIFTVGFEKLNHGYDIIYEGKFMQAKYDASALKNYTNPKYLLMDTSRLEDVKVLSAMVYFGPTFFNGKRFQIPINGGVGLTYVSGYPTSTLHVEFGFKVRAKFYFTDKICVYAGVSGGIGPSGKSSLSGNLASEPSDNLNFTVKPFYYEAGLSVQIGRAKKTIEDW
ncbi:MAG: hypothetical protein K5918_00910 [Bacteroidales bacterium]|nr:hypothetical protein [Bacteroidales bacterium]